MGTMLVTWVWGVSDSSASETSTPTVSTASTTLVLLIRPWKVLRPLEKK